MKPQLINEFRVPFAQVRKAFGVQRTARTLLRWHRIGLPSRVDGRIVKLEAMLEGGGLTTSKEAIDRFNLARSKP